MASDYIKLRKQLSKYKHRAGDFKTQGKCSPDLADEIKELLLERET